MMKMIRSEVTDGEVRTEESGENRMIKTVLFDLDGTLTDSGEGIINCVRYALDRYGAESGSDEDLRSFIGPPLQQQFQKYTGCAEEDGKLLVTYYRERYTEKGIYENRVYDGIVEVLKYLKESGRTLCVATSKPEIYARQITDYFELTPYFTFVGGSLMDGRRTKKAEVIEYVLKNIPSAEKEKTVMIGDRSHDITGAREMGLHSMGVLFGYGSREELEQAGAEKIAGSLKDICDLIDQF